MEDIIEFLESGPKNTFQFRDEFGVYPRKNLHLLLDSNVVEKYVYKRRVHWQLIEGVSIRRADGEMEDFMPKNEIKEKFENFVASMEDGSLSEEMTEEFKNLQDELAVATDTPPQNSIPKKKFKLFGRK